MIRVPSTASLTSLILKVPNVAAHLNASRNHKVQVMALGEAIPAANAMIRVILINPAWMEEKEVEEVDLVDFMNIPRRVQSQCSTISWRS